MIYPHRPVLVEEVVQGLAVRGDGLYVDGTVGNGGHAEVIVKRLDANGGQFIGIDRDQEILQLARQRLEGMGKRVFLIQGDYANLQSLLAQAGFGQVDGLLLDLGLSSLQLDQAERGFSFLREAPLDMRMDRNQKKSAEDLVNELSERQWIDLLVRYGEERFARRIARAVMWARGKGRIRMTTELANIVARAVPYRRGGIHPATRTFQALRIAVNGELEKLSLFLGSFTSLLKPGGRAAIISYHSLEDRLVKQSFRGYAQQEILALINKKPVTPSEQEICENPRARSAKLRVAERL